MKIRDVQLHLTSALWKKSHGLSNLFAHCVQRVENCKSAPALYCILFTFPKQVHLQQLKRETVNFPSPLNPALLLKKKSKLRMLSH